VLYSVFHFEGTKVKNLDLPRVTFGIIVLNGEPFLRYCLEALYSFAHEIIVVEGACPAARAVATADGHSTDGTLETLHRFQAEEDPEDKVQIITREGFWSEKDEQSRAYAQRATGEYLWQVDVDEFYRPEDMQAVLEMLRDDSEITAVSFKQITFWGGFDYIVDGWYLRQGAEIYHRLFKWGKGYQYVTHRPPTVCDSSGRDLREVKWLNGYDLLRRGINLYHYSLLFPKQVEEKAGYYAAGSWGAYSDGIMRWAHENYLTTIHRPFQAHNVHTYPSWIRRFSGQHPEEILRMRKDIETGHLNITCRDNGDIERLLSLPTYKAGRWLLEHCFFLYLCRRFRKGRLLRTVVPVIYDSNLNRLSLG
jgi:glycosyltransferase involved in cell wall biosynthesis